MKKSVITSGPDIDFYNQMSYGFSSDEFFYSVLCV